MVNEIIKKYGLEDQWTIWFCELAEILTEKQLFNAYFLLYIRNDNLGIEH